MSPHIPLAPVHFRKWWADVVSVGLISSCKQRNNGTRLCFGRAKDGKTENYLVPHPPEEQVPQPPPEVEQLLPPPVERLEPQDFEQPVVFLGTLASMGSAARTRKPCAERMESSTRRATTAPEPHTAHTCRSSPASSKSWKAKRSTPHGVQSTSGNNPNESGVSSKER